MGSDFYQHVKIPLLDTQKGVSPRHSMFLQVVDYCLLSGVTYTAVVNHVVFLVVMESNTEFQRKRLTIFVRSIISGMDARYSSLLKQLTNQLTDLLTVDY